MATSVDLLRESLDAWSGFSGRRLSDFALQAWVEQFASFDPGVLEPALKLVTKRAKRMPWPGDLTEAISSVRESRITGHSDSVYATYREIPAKDAETGRPVVVRLYADKQELCYRAIDCPEGREFLLFLDKLRAEKGSSQQGPKRVRTVLR